MNDDQTTIANSAHLPRTSPLNLLLIIVLGLALYLPGIRWGLPSTVSWSQDSVAAMRTLGAVAHWPEQWEGRYPPLHYMVLRAAYQPALARWESTGQARWNPDGTLWLAPPHAPKVTLLILMARATSVLMAIGAGLALYLAVRLLHGDPLSGLMAAMVLMIGADFAYFARLDNVDVPSVFWFAWSFCFFIRLAQWHRLADAACLALFAAAAVSTKDNVAGVYPGMALILIISRVHNERLTGAAWPAATLRALLQPHWLVGLAVFLLSLLLVNGAFWNVHGYWERLRYWIAPLPDSLHARQLRYEGLLALAGAVVRYAASAVGWPMLIAMLLAAPYAMIFHRRVAALTLVPAVGYVVIVIGSIHFVYARFLFVPLALMGICLAVAWTDLWRSAAPGWLRLAKFAVIMAPTLAYTAAVSAEIVYDTRYAAEDWFEQNVPQPASVGAFAMGLAPELRPQYLPRVHEMGYATYPVVMAREWFERPQPDFLILSSHTYDDFDQEQRACMEDLLAGRLGYQVAASFDATYLRGASWLAAAGFGAPEVGKISPKLIILRRGRPAAE